MGSPSSVHHTMAPAPFGGAETTVRALAAGQVARGREVTVSVVLSPGESSPFARACARAGVRVIPIRVPPRSYVRQIREVRRILEEVGPDLVHSHGYRCDLLDATVARSLGIPTATTVHGFTGGDLKNRVYQRLQRRAFRWFDGVVAVSRPLMDVAERSGVPPERLHLVPNAWDGQDDLIEPEEARTHLDVPLRDFHVGWVGRLSPEKGPDVFLDALSSVELAGTTVSMVGSGPLEARLTTRARDLGLGKAVRWHGALPEARRYFPAFDAFVLSSRSEGTPLVLLEAMAARVPIIATTVGGVSDVVGPEEAVLVPPEAPGELARALARVREHPGEAAAMAQRAHRRLKERFGVEPWLDRYDAVYQRILEPRTSAPQVARTAPVPGTVHEITS